MLTDNVLKLVTGISSFLGLAGLICYLYFTQQIRRAEYSIRGLLEGETLFNAEQVLKILAQFQDDASRLEALKTLTRYDGSKARMLLAKVKDNVDIKQVTQISSKHYRQLSLASAIVFLLLAALAFAYAKSSPSTRPTQPNDPSPIPTAGLSPSANATPSPALTLISPKDNAPVLAHGNKKGDAWVEVRGILKNIPREQTFRVYVFYQSADKDAGGWWYYKSSEVNQEGEWLAPHLYLGGDDKVLPGNSYRIRAIVAKADVEATLENLPNTKPVPDLSVFQPLASATITIKISFIITDSGKRAMVATNTNRERVVPANANKVREILNANR